VSLVFNGLRIDEVIIDQHYKLKHPEVSDRVILKLIIQLHNLVLKPKMSFCIIWKNQFF
jgi:hypothetical protein